MVKDISIKNNDMITSKNVNQANLKVDKKYHKHIDIYYIGYITIRKNDDYENIHSVNPLHLTIR